MKTLQNQPLEKIKQSQSPVATSSTHLSAPTTPSSQNGCIFSNPQNAHLGITCIDEGLRPQKDEINSHQTQSTKSPASNRGNKNERLGQAGGCEEAKMMLGKVETLKSLLSNRLSLALKQQQMGVTFPGARSPQSTIPSIPCPQAEKREEPAPEQVIPCRLKESLSREKRGEGELGIESRLGRGSSSQWGGMGQKELISMMDSKIAELKRVLSRH